MRKVSMSTFIYDAASIISTVQNFCHSMLKNTISIKPNERLGHTNCKITCKNVNMDLGNG